MLSTLPLHCAEVTAPNSNARELLTLSSDDDGKEMSIEDAVDILSATSLAPAPSAYYRTKKARVSCPCRNSKYVDPNVQPPSIAVDLVTDVNTLQAGIPWLAARLPGVSVRYLLV